jgi:hypothetical protein
VRHERALNALFGQVLGRCADAGLLRVGVVAVDGTKVSANASERATRDYQQIAREILEPVAEIDAREDEQFGDARGDELPPALATREGPHRSRLTQRQDAARLGAGLQRPSGVHRGSDRDRRRSHAPAQQTSASLSRWSVRPSVNWPQRTSPTLRKSCLPTPATGTPNRSSGATRAVSRSTDHRHPHLHNLLSHQLKTITA